MSSGQTPAQSGANTPRFATLPRSARPTPAASVYNETSHTSSRPVPIAQPAQPSSYFDTDLPAAFSQPELTRDEQRNERMSRSFRDMIPRSLGNEFVEARQPRDQSTRRQPDRQWTLFGQLLEDDGAFRSRNTRRASIAAGTPNRPRAASAVRQPAPPTPGISQPPRREPLPVERVSLDQSLSPHNLLDLPNPSSSHPNLLSDEPPVDQELLDQSDDEGDSLISGSASLTAGSHHSTNQPERPGHPREPTDYSMETDDDDDESSSPPPSRTSRRLSWLRVPTLSPLQQKVLKCSLAYTIGCLFTFVPALSSLLTDIVPLESQQGPSPTGHMVATVGMLCFQYTWTYSLLTFMFSRVLQSGGKPSLYLGSSFRD